MLLAPSGKGRKRQKKGDFGRFRPISRKGGQTPLKPPFVTPPFAAAQQVAFFCCFKQRVAGMSRDLGRDVPDLENIYARKLWADFFVPYDLPKLLQTQKHPNH